MATKKAAGQQPDLIPTPQVGMVVRYYPSDLSESNDCMAFVTKQEAPGQVQLYVIAPSSMPRFRQGVNWFHNPRRGDTSRPFRSNGCWDFLDEDYDVLSLHRNLVERRKNAQREMDQKLAEKREQEARAYKARVELAENAVE